MVIALDTSHFTQQTSGPLTSKQLDDARQAGVRLFRVSQLDADIGYHQVEAIVKYGYFGVQTYRYIPWFGSLEAVQSAKAAIQDIRNHLYDIQYHVHDFEDTWHTDFTQQQKEDGVQYCFDQFVGFCRSGAYSANWYWTQYMSNTAKFKDVPWWVAEWNNDPPEQQTLELKYPFGGITSCEMKQIKGDTYFAGIWCDVNFYNDDSAPPTVPTPPADNFQTLMVNPNQNYRFSVGK